MKSPYRLDHDKVIVPEGDSLLAVIPLSARNMVLTLCEYMNWPAFWRVNPPSELEWDNIQSIIAEVEQAMSTAISVQLLDGRLEEIKTAIEGIESGGGELDCACFEALIPIIMGGQFEPQTPVDWGDPANDGLWDNPASVGNAASSESLPACRLANHLVGAMIKTLDGLNSVSALGASGTSIAAATMLLAIPVVGWATAISLVTATGIWAGILAGGSHLLRSHADYLRENKDAIACSFDEVILDDRAAIRAFLVSLRQQYPFTATLIASGIYSEKMVEEIATSNIANWPGECNCPPQEWTTYTEIDFFTIGMGGGWQYLNPVPVGGAVPEDYGVYPEGVGCKAAANMVGTALSPRFIVPAGTGQLLSQHTGIGNLNRIRVDMQYLDGSVWQVVTNSGGIVQEYTGALRTVGNVFTIAPDRVYRLRIRNESTISGYLRWTYNCKIALSVTSP